MNTGVTEQTVTQQPLSTHDMVVVHRAFRRESALLASLIEAAPDGDIARAGVLADHLRWYQFGLTNHHHGEDELIWPLLWSRVHIQTDVIARMQAQHDRLAETLDVVTQARSDWERSASAAARDHLVATLTDHRTALIDHLDDEESDLLPLAGRYLTKAEWDALGEHFLSNTPKAQLLIFLGAVLEDADDIERATMLAAMPAPARLIWRTVGRALYARRVRRVRGRG
jgi:hemerythrin-like domain-containing protein